MTASIRIHVTPPVQYLLRWGDTCLIHAQRIGEWSGHGPVLEEDIAGTNLALDLLGQARTLFTHAGRLEGRGRAQAFSEDELAFLRDEDQFFNLTLVEQPSRRMSAHSPGGDFADLTLRNLLVATWFKLAWERLSGDGSAGASSDAELAAIAGKAVKEARYHQQHAADWLVRLGAGTAESKRRVLGALQRAWPYVGELFADDGTDVAAAASGLGPARSSLREPWLAELRPVFADASVVLPEFTSHLSTGTQGVHSEHMGFMLAEMQALQRQFPGGRW